MQLGNTNQHVYISTAGNRISMDTAACRAKQDRPQNRT